MPDTMTQPFIVTEKAQRPARMDGTCFYCQQKVGDRHKTTCVLISKKAKIRVSMELEVDVPYFWGDDDIDFFYNESSSCASNTLEKMLAEIEKHNCPCGVLETTVIDGSASGAFLSEGP